MKLPLFCSPGIAGPVGRALRTCPPKAWRRHSSAGALLLVLAACSRHAGSAAAPAMLPAPVHLAIARAVTSPALTDVAGTIRPVQRATLAAKVMGAIDELPVALGQRVHAGDVLLKISAGEISARVLQAQSRLNLVRRDLARERDLLAKGASTADTVKGLADRLALTEAMLREAETMLDYTTLRAPFEGVVARKFVDAGDLAAPGRPLLEIEGTDAFEIDVPLPDSLAEKLSVGSPLTVNVPVAGLSFNGQLTELSSAADPSAHAVDAKVSVPAGTAVRSGQFARIQVPGAPVSAILVPAAAVTTRGQLERVFVARRDHRAELRLVKTGATHGDEVEILSGLDNGEQLVVPVPADLREGQPLETAR
ncbi:MAG TPA: efflux RND transporter periplasmic adaptor subunit [Opitutus sp.]|nr:efflux RND transporter periplasmic adaptor subunit [Opitutus sp.]